MANEHAQLRRQLIGENDLVIKEDAQDALAL